MDEPNAARDIEEALASVPEGTYKLYRGTGTGVENSIQTHLRNLSTVGQRIEHAQQVGCLIEVISLRLQIIDFWLRVFFTNKASEGQRRQREFGRLLQQCKELGLQPDLHRRLKEFNRHRVDAVHGYVIGRTSYEALEAVVAESKRLSTDLIVFVLENAGRVITSLAGSYFVGDMILNVRAQIRQLRSQPPL